jgi:thymidylate synthase (FAD)
VRVELIAWTQINRTIIGQYMELEKGTRRDDPERLIEFAGRACYGSFNRPNSLTARLVDYLRNIIRQRHFSVFEHSQATFYITGVSRSLTHELIRHRHLSYSELSQRFVDVEEAVMVTPPALDGRFLENALEMSEAIWSARRAYREIVDYLTDKGLKRKQAREAARAVMPNMVETRIVVTGNFRAWRDVLAVRGTIHADREIRALAVEVGRQLKFLAPGAFQDLMVYTDTDGHESVLFELEENA